MSLEYSAAYHLHSQIALDSGRVVTLRSLSQRMTYAGWREGMPSRDCNDRIVENALKDAGRDCPEDARRLLIDPPRRDYLRHPGDVAGRRTIRGQAPEWLPLVTCVGTLGAPASARDARLLGPVVTLVWFQDEYAFPIDRSILERIKSIEWGRSPAGV